MKKTIVVIIVLIVVGIGVYLIVSKNKQTTNQTNIPVNQSSVNTVSIKNLAFNPQILKIKAGTTVTWVNDDPMAHTITSDSDNLLNSPALSPRESFSFTFTNIGTTNYHCNIHKTMQGTIVVE